ncbi:hypothetical protein [Saccharopolyspora dendranthemae]|uniref:Uncharacterized protein n=1 Tax=Saccharopolyspora dendranthemae TaxID=1181886 RepID=A0A561V7G7_9PSEU|nr:hypothetical protein [Saccharopolyspora dendranthemae]TWG07565.1 hypothetical protein FHU35_11182 [Saccharopolyspora dendranthemae]
MLALASEAAVKWTDVASFAVSSCSVLVATTAAYFAFCAYQKQAGQLVLAQKHDLRWQSRQVTGWVEPCDDLIDARPIVVDPWPLSLGRRCSFFYINASDLPIYQVLVTAEAAGSDERIIASYPRLMPTRSPERREIDHSAAFPEIQELAQELFRGLPDKFQEMSVDFEKTYGRSDARRNLFGEIKSGASPELAVPFFEARSNLNDQATEAIETISSTLSMYFTDSEGNRWKRRGDGGLQLVDPELAGRQALEARREAARIYVPPKAKGRSRSPVAR